MPEGRHPARAKGKSLVSRLGAEARAGKPGRIADHLFWCHLVILDELRYPPFALSGGQLLLHLVSKLYTDRLTKRGSASPGGKETGGARPRYPGARFA